jgi:peptidyl-prolyl cis-trans isomerase A (cyclophilin A)
MRTAKALTLALMAAISLAAAPAPAPKATTATNQKLLNPAALNAQAPATYKVKFQTSKGDFVVEVTRAWAPNGADRFYNLVKNGFFDDTRFFRVVPNFMVQFGINGTPSIQTNWREATIKDDPVKESNKRGYITFATSGPNSRTSQVFINFRDNTGLDRQGFAPFGQVAEGMDVVDKINAEYGERPSQGNIQAQGNAYLNKEFPKLDYVKKATIEK